MRHNALRNRWSLALVALALLSFACAPNDADPIGSPVFNGTTPTGESVEPPITTLPPPDVDALQVPTEFFTIQEAVDAAQPGDLILVDPGVYTEEISISSPDIVIRGRDREAVFIDGIHSLATGITVRGDGVAIENLTVRNFTLDAVAIGDEVLADAPPVDGVRVEYVTTSNTGRHGIVARHATNVEVVQAWTSGHGGAGVSIENCGPCRTLIRDSMSEFSARGFAFVGTDATTHLVTSTSRNNRVGVVIEDGEVQTVGSTVAGTLLLNNGFSTTPQINPLNDHAYGTGIHVSGTSGVQLIRNRLAGNIRAAVLLGSNPLAADQSLTAPIDIVLDGNSIEPHPEGDVFDVGAGQVWAPWTIDTIPYVNGPVPTGIVGMADPDGEEPTPAGPVIAPDLAAITTPTV